MKLYLDTANLDDIQGAAETGLLDGVTTNPTLIARERRDFEPHIKAIDAIVQGPVCVECVGASAAEMVTEAKRLIQLGRRIIIKIPMGAEGLKTVKILKPLGIPTIVTLCFSPLQVLLAAMAGASFAAVFVGRLDDIGLDGMQVITDAKNMLKNYGLATGIIVASVRSPLHVARSAAVGVDVVTMPYNVFNRLAKHHLTDSGLAQFMKDWAGYRQ